MTDDKMLNLQNMQKFFEIDVKIKEMLYELAPDKGYMASEDYKIKLSDKMYESLSDMKFYLEKILLDFGMEDYKEHLNGLISSFKQEIAEAGIDSRKLEAFYKNCLSDMRPELVEETGYACRGHVLASPANAHQVLLKTKTINEFLHVVHSQILNDNYLYEQMPLVEHATACNLEDVRLYGVDSKMAKIAHQALSSSIGVGGTDVLGINEDHVICMIRDKGHSVMIEMNRNEDETISIKYHIAKTCNIEMINALKGVRPINEYSSNINGSFEVSDRMFGVELLSLVSNIPDDGNMSQEDAGTQHFELSDILQKMDFPHYVDFIQNNPVVTEIFNIAKYTEQKYEYELYMAKKEQDEAILNGESIDKIERLTFKIKDIISAGEKVGLGDNDRTVDLDTIDQEK